MASPTNQGRTGVSRPGAGLSSLVGVAGPEEEPAPSAPEGELPTRPARLWGDRAEQPFRSRTCVLSGCRPVRLSCEEIADYEGRYEYWEAATETAWVLRDTSPRHEHPSSRLVALVSDIGKLRGKPVFMYGTADLQERGPDGARVYAAQPDQMIYLDRPDELPEVIVVGNFPLPDVVFEVDLTTDIRDRKLDLYASWGVPELWVDVPDADMPSKRKRPGLTIYLMDNGAYRESPESEAFPTWSAREIHKALNEPWTSSMTLAAMRRVGETMGRLAGTRPEDDPFVEAERRIGRLSGLREGKAAGLEEGRREGLEAGRREGLEEGREAALRERLSAVERLLTARNIRVAGLDESADRIAALPLEAVLDAALESRSPDDFLHRLHEG